jgi:hypothetical protein
MATAPIQPPMAPEMAQEEMMEEPMEGESNGSRFIEIEIRADGTFRVGEESSSYEAAEEQGAEAAGETKEEGKSYPDIKSALTAVLALVKGTEPVDAAGEKSAMAEGFGS